MSASLALPPMALYCFASLSSEQIYPKKSSINVLCAYMDGCDCLDCQLCMAIVDIIRNIFWCWRANNCWSLSAIFLMSYTKYFMSTLWVCSLVMIPFVSSYVQYIMLIFYNLRSFLWISSIIMLNHIIQVTFIVI